MHSWISLSLNDVRNVLRDRLLVSILFVPFILLLFVRGVMPLVLEQYPEVGDYQHIICMLAAAQIPTTMGLIASFVMLDEKDEQLFQVLRSLPVSAYRFLAFRLGWVSLFTFLGACLFLAYSGLMVLSTGQILQAASLYALLSVLLTLFIVTYTDNKVAGLAVFKGLNIALYLPVLPWFWDQSWLNVLAVLPTYWPFRVLGQIHDGQNSLLSFGVGMLIIGAIILLLLQQFRKRAFN